MGDFGPIPKRSDQLIRRNEKDPIDKVTSIAPTLIPDLNIENCHPLVTDLYRSLKLSAQRTFFEPSDWHYARLAMYVLNEQLNAQKAISAVMLASINQMLTSLLMTEGDRRRVRIEIERSKDTQEGKVLQVADLFRQRLEQPQTGGA